MKCPNCNGQMGLEDAFCPYCGTPNAMAAKHQSDMDRFQQEYQRTQTDVMERTSFMQQHGSWLVILVVLLAALVIGVVLQIGAWDIGYSVREGNVKQSMLEDEQVLDAFLESGDYGKFVGYYDANDIDLIYDNPYQALQRAAYSYVDILSYISALTDDSSRKFSSERTSGTCEQLASDLIRIYNLEREYSGYEDKYIPSDKRVYLEDIRNRVKVIAEAYLGLTDKDIQDIPDMSKKKLASLIEKGIAL